MGAINLKLKKASQEVAGPEESKGHAEASQERRGNRKHNLSCETPLFLRRVQQVP